MIKQIISLGLIKYFNDTKLEENNNIATMFAQCLHIFKLFIIFFKIVNLISISITMGVLRYNKFDLLINSLVEILS